VNNTIKGELSLKWNSY